MNDRMANAARFFAMLAGAVSVQACSAPRLPHPTYVSHPTSALDEVPHPAPPPLVEKVPPSPSKQAVWIDGEWRYSAGQWRWQHGSWVVPDAGLAFSPPVEVRSADGTLYFAPGTWRNAQGEAVEDPEILARARSQAVNNVVNASGERESVGRTRSGSGSRQNTPPPAGPRP